MSITGINTVLSRIKEKLSLSEIIGKDVMLRKSGREYVGYCPFHNEKTGSFFVNDNKGTFYCFGCGASGDVVTYLMKKRGLQFMQAIELLAEAAGIKLQESTNYSNEHKAQLSLMQKALEFFKEHLRDDVAAKYCVSRGFDESCITQFSIGYAPKNSDLLLSHLKSSGFSMCDILQSGLFQQRNGRVSCYFRGRLIFPVFNKQGWPIAFGGRVLQQGESPKYLNSRESVLFQKRATLYAFNIASKNVSKTKNFILVEGYIDVITMHQHGFDTAIASMGTSFSIEHLVKIWKLSSEPIVCLDGDTAGYNAMLKIALLAMQYLSPGKSLRFCIIPDASDPDSFLKKFGKSAMEKILENSSYLIDFIWQHFLNQLGASNFQPPEKVAEWKKHIMSTINSIEDIDIRNLYRSDINNRIFHALRTCNKKNFTPINSLTKPLANTASMPLYSVTSQPTKTGMGEKRLLREAAMLYIILECPSVVPYLLEELAAIRFSRDGFEAVRDMILGGDNMCTGPGAAEIQYIKAIASRSCSLTDKSDDEIVKLWRGIYEHECSYRRHLDDIRSAKNDCSERMDAGTWERLRALKINHIGKNSEHTQDNNH
ncbi:MAG: DNA primase [Holosporales bacterium]|jgi:DNA primase|nr:DNA primase [Holosporales bacterium]